MATAALLFLLVASSPYQRVSQFEPPHESVVVPTNGFRDPSWLADLKTLRPAPEIATGDYYLSGEEITHGSVRWQLKGGEATVLLVRARSDDAGLSGWGVRLESRWVRMVSVGSGKVQNLRHRVMLPRRDAREVVFSVFGTSLIVGVYDESSGELLAVTSAEGIAVRKGALAMMVDDASRQPATLTRASIRRACASLPKRISDAGAPILAVVDSSDAAATRSYGIELERVQNGVGFRVDSIGLERTYCEGIPLRRVETDLPWKYEDLPYLRASQRGDWGQLSNKNPEMVEAVLKDLHRRYPDRTHLEAIGRTHQGRTLWALAIANPIEERDSRAAVLLAAAHHGDELLSTEIVLDAIEQILEKGSPEELTIWCVPMVNPDGVAVFLNLSVRAGRTNGRDLDGDGERGVLEGVDLNRNYPIRWQLGSSDSTRRFYRGPKAASEPEVVAMMALAERERFAAAISYHMGTIALLAPYSIEGMQSPEPNEAWTVGEEVARALNATGRKRPFKVRSSLYKVSGTDQDWLRHSYGTVALLIESGVWPPPVENSHRRAATRKIRPSWQKLIERYVKGPLISGRVVDAKGKPVEAEVRVREIATRAGERWTSRPRDGRFDRFVPVDGVYHLQVEIVGAPALEKRVKVKGRTWVEVVMPVDG